MRNLTKQDIEMVMRIRVKLLKQVKKSSNQKLRNHATREILEICRQLGEDAPA